MRQMDAALKTGFLSVRSLGTTNPTMRPLSKSTALLQSQLCVVGNESRNALFTTASAMGMGRGNTRTIGSAQPMETIEQIANGESLKTNILSAPTELTLISELSSHWNHILQSQALVLEGILGHLVVIDTE
ncbi:hypothetical protein BATDEDRAFT_24742 [Batrachochytrium dendrobatidis JAM81]|uniref:Uncharacterized protein n=2 Tax=Batrachochytrium dendrobatidis TaxID=109871 RepID=F4P292_BATDJ|nr:uncharacterized protein BATDEDRAFT_24742 [Batrachochytrium dendrobatidis JAM81]EGF80817.1 hypothetical protein BATDEDRAFT_24742 [Batrachochytrium dendrobatidis JAM81]|eukprot:XP_006678525.1 hypothetical protein BATDEDRAFT_24742 [Batrachochytrium dendrobatidis JAM81]